MSRQAVIQNAWEQACPILNELMIITGYQAYALRIRGYNPNSVNSPRKAGELRVWGNGDITVSNQVAREAFYAQVDAIAAKHIETLTALWKDIYQEIGPDLEHVIFAPRHARLYKPGIYCELISHDSLPFFMS